MKSEIGMWEEYRQSLAVLSEQGFCVYGQYPWDAWKRVAQGAGVLEELAVLGRAVMREAYQHCWCERFYRLCGWGDGGRCMIALALRSPETARRRWEWLMETDGQRVDRWDNYEWVWEEDPRWSPHRRRWLKERRTR